MELEKIESLIKLMRSHGLHEMQLTEGNETIRLTQSAQPSQTPVFNVPTYIPQQPVSHHSVEAHTSVAPSAPTEKSADSRKGLIEVRSPFVGTYYASSSPGSDPFVSVNKSVKKGDPLCIVEAMKLMNEIEAERDGVIVEILVQNEQSVEYDQVLFLMK